MSAGQLSRNRSLSMSSGRSSNARHTEEIQLLAVDTVSDRGAGRLVVSYDAGQTAIVWDCMTGDEVARFASYENLTVAAWMRNGNVAFGKPEIPIALRWY
ncbi:hypothetical protein D0Z07_1811 [Hyphodiscus hymeniophilus]|uniref:Uncharacterized protein n=1 Tax=Hyphodiscus hymeniophilus TaxID=353542 RepID=A0A9P7AZV3_9HELO|nr:hypothetical protein D0Z07_1811 [Hyphodiscus hymeniophilus]